MGSVLTKSRKRDNVAVMIEFEKEEKYLFIISTL